MLKKITVKYSTYNQSVIATKEESFVYWTPIIETLKKRSLLDSL